MQSEKAKNFKALHKKGNPVVLYNIWDAGGAKALADAGANAVATGSWSVAAAHGFEDGEAIPLSFVLQIVERIVKAVDLPVTVDFEGGYAADTEGLAVNARKVIKAGAIGINFEDQIIREEGLYSISTQVERIRAIREAATDENVPLFINARTDLFLGAEPETHKSHIAEAIEREVAYAEAGADGFFVPGLTNATLIERVVDTASLPVNVMMTGALSSVETTAKIGVARVSFGPGPYFAAVSDIATKYNAII